MGFDVKKINKEKKNVQGVGVYQIKKLENV